MSLYLFNYAYICMFVSALSDPTSNSERSAIGGNKQILYCIVKPATPPVLTKCGEIPHNKLNWNVLDKIGSAMATSDDKERNNLLQEGEALLVEQNKHICLADKYGWDTVECYTAEPLASDSNDE